LHADLKQGRGAPTPCQRCSSTASAKSGSELPSSSRTGQRLQPVTGAIVLWNTVVTWNAATQREAKRRSRDDELPAYLSRLGWSTINLTGNYVWRQSRRAGGRKFRPLRLPENLKVHFSNSLFAPI